ncbi:LamG domain-containing protein [bacterium]|nr:LamG domain-containing protein [bacterium]MBU1064916.1 LamG domain-containing protein [bacterium]MBU1634160.1 LamG domain-containing protein [bacterium]MBU1874253.1 LamG domain-containing protein [bacterium]
MPNERKNLLIISFLSVWLMGFSSQCGNESVKTISSMGFTGEHYLEISNNASIKSFVSGDFAIEIWACGDSSRADLARTLVMLGNNNGGNEIAIYQGAIDSSMVIVYIDDNLFGMFSVSELDWSAREKHYLCLSRADNFFSFYVDGRRLKSVSMENTDLDIGSSNMLIGADYDLPGVNSNPGNYWVGTIDEVRIWTKAIQSSEVSFHNKYPDKLTEHYSSNGLEPLIGIWRFNNEQTGIIPDESGSGNDAVIRGNGESLFWVSE